MKNERELFLYELKGRGYEFRNTDWHADWERFEDDQLNMAWEMWIASANRDGYKLVPVEPTEKMLMSIYDDCGNYVGDGVAYDFYKAMIGASE